VPGVRSLTWKERPITSLSQISDTLSNSTDLLLETVFGGVDYKEVPWIECFFLVEREGITNNLLLGLETKIKPMYLPTNLTWKKKEVLWNVRQKIQGEKFLRVGVDENFVLKSLEEMAHKCAPSFYEIDPRIGMFHIDDPKPIPECPLFDPINPIARASTTYRVYQKEWSNSGSRMMGQPSSLSLAFPCVFCSISVLDATPSSLFRVATENRVVWGGGNIGWVHRKCAPWIPQSRNIPT